MLLARKGHTVTLMPDGRVLIAGGIHFTGPVSTTEIYDPATKNVTAGPDLPYQLCDHSATLV
jgi:hypothetical protein